MQIFLASSQESLGDLREVSSWIEEEGHEPVPWDSPSLFLPGENTFEKLIKISKQVDAAVFIFAEDDRVWYRADALLQPRDNVLVEFGMFSGSLGQRRAIICTKGSPKTATDLRGIVMVDKDKPHYARLQLQTWLRNLAMEKHTHPITLTEAEDFFYTLDDKPSESFPSMVQNALSIRILGRTAVNLLSQYQKLFEQLGQSGCEIRLLFVDPSSEACNFLYGSNPELYRHNMITAASHLKKLRCAVERQLEARVTKHAPTASIIIIEKQDMQQGFLQVQLYFLHGALGRDRPVFRVNYGDKWYGVFQEEFDGLWSESREWDEAQFLQTVTAKSEK
jgi:hypothetical protein